MDERFQLLNDQEQGMRMMLDGRQVGMWTALPGIIEALDLAAMTCTVQPAIQAVVVDADGSQRAVNLPLLLDVPIVFPKGGNFLLTSPIAVGEEVLVVFSSRCIDAWWQSGGVQQAMEARMHDLSDGFAIPGPYSVPNVPGGAVSTTRIELRNKARTVYFGVGTKFVMKNQAADLKGALDDLVSAVNGFMTTVGALALLPPATPVTASMIGPAGATAVTQLTAVTAKITALLESS